MLGRALPQGKHGKRREAGCKGGRNARTPKGRLTPLARRLLPSSVGNCIVYKYYKRDRESQAVNRLLPRDAAVGWLTLQGNG
jgi:hypothetical protein